MLQLERMKGIENNNALTGHIGLNIVFSTGNLLRPQAICEHVEGKG